MEDGGLLLLQLLFLVFLILLNAFFASSEVALISLKPAAAKRLENEGRRGRRLTLLLADSGRFLATVQVGVTFAGFMASAFAAESFSDPVTEFLRTHGFAFLRHAALDGVVVFLITLLLSYISLVFGELVPKQLGLRYAEPIALNVACVIDFFARVTAPFVWILNRSVDGCLRLMGVPPRNSQQVTEEEIRMMVDIGEENGAIESDEKRMIENVFEFDDTPVGEVMTHRTAVVALELDSSPETIERTLMECGFSRLPVYRGTIDEIVGFLHFRDYFTAKMNGGAVPELRELLKPVFLAPETMRANLLLHNMRKKKIGMAVILDEFGGTSGVVTVEDLLEEIVGSLYDEYDDAGEEAEPLGENQWRLDGAMRIDELARLLDRELELPDYDTVAGLIFGYLNEVPTVGAKVALPEFGLAFEVETVHDRRVGKVLLTVFQPEAEEDCSE